MSQVSLSRRGLLQAGVFSTVGMTMPLGAGRLLAERTGILPTYQIVKYNGRPLTAAELRLPLRRIAAGNAEPITIVRNPWE